jgi:hypothetical protein
MVKRDNIRGHNGIQCNIVTANGFEHAPPLKDLYANDAIENHDNENDKPREKEKAVGLEQQVRSVR